MHQPSWRVSLRSRFFSFSSVYLAFRLMSGAAQLEDKVCLVLLSVIESSAINDNTKRATMAQELVRRMLNVSELLNQEERNSVIEKFMEKLKKSGYSKKQRSEIALAGLQ